MKKLFLSLIALTATLYVSAQTVTVTLQVDVTNFVAQQGPILPTGMRVGGTFGALGATNNGTAMVDWTPTDPTSAMTDLGNNLWSIDVTFPASLAGSVNSADSLQFKFVDSTWFNGAFPRGTNEDANNTDTLVQGQCVNVGNGNRMLGVPANHLTYRWCYNHCLQCDGSNPLVTGVKQINKVSVFNLTPNPASNGQSTLLYSVDAYSPVNITLMNIMGQELKTIVNTNRPAGTYNQTIDLNGLSTGIYLLRLTSGNQTVTKRVIL